VSDNASTPSNDSRGWPVAWVYDLFHVVVKYGHEVIDRVRVDTANVLRHDKPARKLIRGSRWLLLKNAENID
jgi:transposase